MASFGAQRQASGVEHDGEAQEGKESEGREDDRGEHLLAHHSGVDAEGGERHERGAGVHDGRVHGVFIGDLGRCAHLLAADGLHLPPQRLLPRVELEDLHPAQRFVLQLHAAVRQLGLLLAQRADHLEEVLLQRDEHHHDPEAAHRRPADVGVQQQHVPHGLQYPA
eukprot:CAMPEP_0181394302 /NCGR_PEP_ID=MMETSP1106-20121128/27709_1 /TAXON_ID=81844 /ORGANISM="Mantoniella antarctica, Strain SL-175" /LENGTH=165 /DNA_ID=CAMNT_0023515797 /DNA_START=79 /DNA_END=572 /DNA_ORIENTATION=-